VKPRIETDFDPGISETDIVIGTLLPEKGALNGLAQSMGDVLQAYFAEVNNRGGIYNRKIELRIMYGDPNTTVSNLKHLIDDDQVFAMVSGLTAGAEEGVTRLILEKEVPFIGPSTLLPQRGLPLNRYLFYLLPGLTPGSPLVQIVASELWGPTWSRSIRRKNFSPLPLSGFRLNDHVKAMLIWQRSSDNNGNRVRRCSRDARG
jgi:hypothetical protein